MLKNRGIIVVLITAVFALNGCVAPPPRERVVYHEGSDDQNYSGRYCHLCGTVRDIDQVELRQGNSGGGAVLGAIIGGLIGNQFGKGNGKTLATVGGAVAGGFAGNEVQKHVTSKEVWVTRVKMKDGALRYFEQEKQPVWKSGEVVKVQKNTLTLI